MNVPRGYTDGFYRISSSGTSDYYTCGNILNFSLDNNDGLLILRNTSPQESYYDCYINCRNDISCFYLTYNCLTSECKLYDIDKASSSFDYYSNSYVIFPDSFIVSQRLITASNFITGIFSRYENDY